MKALVWHDKDDVRVDTVPDPVIEAPTDVIVKITATAICRSDLHLLDGYQPTMKEGDILGHEPMGIVVEVGSAVKKLKKGDRVVVPCCSCPTSFRPDTWPPRMRRSNRVTRWQSGARGPSAKWRSRPRGCSVPAA